jgi:hypothetical protein
MTDKRLETRVPGDFAIFTLSWFAGDLWDDEADRLGDELALLPCHGLARLVTRPHLPRLHVQTTVNLSNLAGKKAQNLAGNEIFEMKKWREEMSLCYVR